MVSQRTKKAIRSCFIELLNEKPFDRISVKDIAERCGVTRNAFYYHYADIYALLAEIFELEIAKVAERVEEYDSWQEAFCAATAFAAENRNAVYHLFNSSNESLLERYYYESVLTAMRGYVWKEAAGLHVAERHILTLARFYTAALTGLTGDWLRSGMKGDANAFIEEIGDMLDGNIRSALERCSRRDAQEAAQQAEKAEEAVLKESEAG